MQNVLPLAEKSPALPFKATVASFLLCLAFANLFISVTLPFQECYTNEILRGVAHSGYHNKNTPDLQLSNRKNQFFTVLKTVKHKSRLQQMLCLVRAPSWFTGSCDCPKPSLETLLGAPIPFVGSSKICTTKYHHIGVRLQHIHFGIKKKKYPGYDNTMCELLKLAFVFLQYNSIDNSKLFFVSIIYLHEMHLAK